jgi:Rrf2 family protein
MLGKTTEYAIRSLVYIYIRNLKGERPGFKEIARNIGSPEGFTGKVLQIITGAGLVSSMKGRGGGFFFDNPDKPLSLLDIINVTEGQEFFHKCGFGLKSCDTHNPCPMHDEYVAVRKSFYGLVNTLTIQSLAFKVSQNKAVLNRLEITDSSIG